MPVVVELLLIVELLIVNAVVEVVEELPETAIPPPLPVKLAPVPLPFVTVTESSVKSAIGET